MSEMKKYIYTEPNYPILKREMFDEDIMKPLLNDENFSKKDRQRLSLYNKHRSNGSCVNVSYKFGSGCEELQLGRLFPDDGIGLQSYRFDIRNPLAQKWYWDTDVENCHYRIAEKQCIDLDIKHDKITYYINNRDTCLKLVSNTRKVAKTEFLKVLYMGNIKLYSEFYDDNDGPEIKDEGITFLKELKAEVELLAYKIWDKYPQLHNLKMGRNVISKRPNPKASLMSLIFQTEERKLLLAWDCFLQQNNRTLAVFIHDGGYVEKLKNEAQFPDELLTEGANFIKCVLGYNVVLTLKPIEHCWKPSKPLDIEYVALTDNDASEYLFSKISKKLIYCRSQLFLKNGHVWSCDTDFIHKWLLNYILTSKIYAPDNKPYAQNVTHARHIRDALLVKIETNIDCVDLYEKFHSTTKGTLCFKDGVLDFINKRFILWDDVDFEYYSCIIINRNYAEYFSNPNYDVINEIKSKIYENLFGKDLDTALHFLSRAIAGHCEDKNWATYLGNRDCGKGVLYDSLSFSLEEYVGTFELNNILYQRQSNTEETSRMLYWLIDLQFVRLAVSQETPSVESGMKASGKMIKKMAGGGDTHVARRNYDRKDTHFKIDTTFLIMGNNELIVDTPDTMEHCLEFRSTRQFKSQEEIEKMKVDGESELLWSSYKIKDDNIKSNCQSEEWKNAIIFLLYQNYKNKSVVIHRDGLEDDEAPLRRKILTLFTITGNVKDEILVSEVEQILNNCKKKIKYELESMGVIKKQATGGENRKKWVYCGLTVVT